jgi:hypothetical protein
MDLWIKSQDKKLLIKVNHIMRINNRIFAGDTLGEYDSEERAIEILDEIQNLLQPRIIVNGELDSEQENALCYFFSSKNVGKVMPRSIVDMNCIPLDTIVYEMPEK